ncbi:conserved domain protein [Streptococcus porcinus str. Jelinkova 176]|uniref:Conserved domain protein n=1 Tax=Streptococcus porcinus str. Jelinkova 176 TaxID=873448 RepID=A0ABN0CWZ1_STRPO|nr:conserved domain protein [Streptococcus porcinus str. Jelinkova 176]
MFFPLPYVDLQTNPRATSPQSVRDEYLSTNDKPILTKKAGKSKRILLYDKKPALNLVQD